MNTVGKLLTVLVAAMLNVMATAESTCGSLDERLLFSTDTSTEPAEYPWMGILLQREDQAYRNAGCNVVIVSEKHVLTTASCVRKFNDRPELLAVRLGIWNETHQPGEDYICDDMGFCVPGPVDYPVDAVTVHPLADKDTGNNDLALLQLSKPVEMTKYIQPVCLDPIAEPTSWINMDFHFGGFEETQPIKGKGSAIAISRQYCTQISETATPPPENQFCAYPVKRTTFYNGAALLGINVEKDVPQSFYLVAMLVKVVDVGQTTVFFFQDIRPSRRWLLSNTHSVSSS